MVNQLFLNYVSEGTLYSSDGQTIVGYYYEFQVSVFDPETGIYVPAVGFNPWNLGLVATSIRGEIVSVEAANYGEAFKLAVQNCYIMLKRNCIQMPQKTYEARKADYKASKAKDARVTG